MKIKAKIILSFSAALLFIMSCTACKTVDTGANIADVS